MARTPFQTCNGKVPIQSLKNDSVPMKQQVNKLETPRTQHTERTQKQIATSTLQTDGDELLMIEACGFDLRVFPREPH